jgi:serine/threonine protein phosphatase PrpC
MEDAHACILDLQPLEGDEELKPAASDVRISFFGVYDGHGGDKVAIYTGERSRTRTSSRRSRTAFWPSTVPSSLVRAIKSAAVILFESVLTSWANRPQI